MKANRHFNPSRLLLLMRNEMWMIPWAIPVFLGAMGLLTLFVLSLQRAEDLAFMGYMHVIIYPSLLSFGLFGAAFAIEDLHKDEKACAWLMLPASLLEKYVSRVVLTSLGYFLAVTIAYTVFAKMIEGLFWFKFSESALYVNPLDIPFNPFDSVVLDFFAVYILAHAVVLVGGLYFRSIGYFIVILVIYELINLTIPAAIDLGIADTHLKIIKTIDRIPFLFWGLIVSVCWIGGYYLLKRVKV